MFKEIVVEQIADFEEEVGVDPRSIEDFVDVLAREIKLFGKPGDASALVAELYFDKVSYVRFFCHAFASFEPAPEANKKGVTVLLLTYHVGIGKRQGKK